MRVEETVVGDVIVLALLEARIDKRAGQDLKEVISNLVTKGHRRLVLDLTQVSFIDSTGLGAIVSSLKILGRQGELVVCGAGAAVVSLLRLTRLDKVLRAFPTSVDALAALRLLQPTAHP